MPAASRVAVSSTSLIRGALVAETRAALAAWDLARPKRENLARLRETNPYGARSTSWAKKITAVLSQRFDPAGRDRPLVLLARGSCPVDVFRPVLLWHVARADALFHAFVVEWLYPAFDNGAHHVRPDELLAWVRGRSGSVGEVQRRWSDATRRRVAEGMLKAAADFGLLTGTLHKEFASYHLPEPAFLYLLHAMREEQPNPRKVLDSPDWRMFLMRPGEVEQQVLRLHQFRKLEYHAAGSLAELTLPCSSPREFAERMVA